MKLDEYQAEAARTAPALTMAEGLTCAALGICGEGGEFADLVKKWGYQGHPLDTDKIVKELGDVLWYVALAATTLRMTLSEVAEANVTKLRARYPDGFSSDASVNRTHEAE